MFVVVSCGASINPFVDQQGAIDNSLSTSESYGANSSDIMLQAFAWRSKWNGEHGAWYDGISSVADDISDAGFTVVWFPPPSKTNRYDVDEHGDAASACGYMPMDYKDVGEYQQWVQDGNGWYQHAGSETLYGSKTELTSAISTLHSDNIKVLADIVVNHRAAERQNSQSEWDCWSGVDSGFAAWDGNDPVQIITQEGGSGGAEGSWSWGGRTYYCSDFSGSADLSHWQSSTRSDIKSYLSWLKNTIGFDGWRYDYVRGFAPQYIGEYNDYTSPYMSVGEYWVDGVDRQELMDYINASGGKTMLFDYTTKGLLNDVLYDYDFQKLKDSENKPAGGIGWWPSMMVTFVDNHDTGYSANGGGQHHWPIPDDTDPNHAKALMGYAYILTHPGVPCVYWFHWADCGSSVKSAINDMIEIRESRKITSTSPVTISVAEQGRYGAYIGSGIDQVALRLGSTYWSPGSGLDWSLKASGGSTSDYKIYVKNLEVPNPGFETSWAVGSTPTDWVKSPSSGFTADYSTAYKKTGSASCKLHKTVKYQRDLISQFDARENTKYTASVDFFNNGDGSSSNQVAGYVIAFYNASGNYLGYVWSNYVYFGSSWQNRQKTFTTPAGTATIKLKLRLYSDSLDSGVTRDSVYADNIKIY